MTPDTATTLSTALSIGLLLVFLGLCCYLEKTFKD